MVAMSKRELLDLLAAYDFHLSETNELENRMRFKGRGTFIDLWTGRRGLTIGIFDPKRHAMKYRRNLNWDTLEEEIMKIKT